LHEAGDHRGDGRADCADRETDGREDAGKFGDIEGRFGGRRRDADFDLLSAAGNPGLRLVGDVLVAGGGHFLDLLVDHAGDPFIWAPKGLADADGVLD